MDRRTFLAHAGIATAGVLAGCSSDESSQPSSTDPPTPPQVTSTTSASTTTIATTAATTTTTNVATTTVSPVETGPWWLRENFAPVVGELDATDLEVNGTIPTGLDGTWVRNGPNPQTGESVHWFDGDGMLHGVRIAGGRAEWYGRRYVQTPYLADIDPSELVIPGGAVTRANVSTVQHGGHLLALGEVGHPYEISLGNLSTVGPYDFDGRLQTAMTAHPKIDPSSGEMHFFGYGFADPFLTYHVADRAGSLLRSVPIALPNAPMMHDFAITDRSIVFMDLGIRFDLSTSLAFPFRFDPAFPCRIGVLDRAATTDTTRWFDIESCFVFHVVNAFQSGQQIMLDVIRYEELWTESSDEAFAPAVPFRYVIDLDRGTVRQAQLDDRWVEFPTIDRRLTGLPHDVSWTADIGPSTSEPRPSTLIQHDARGASVSSQSYTFPGLDVIGEPLFVADPDRAAGRGGWIMLVVYRNEEARSDIVILDAESIADGPIATIELPVRVPFGFHATFASRL